jgi:hypothetical protein
LGLDSDSTIHKLKDLLKKHIVLSYNQLGETEWRKTVSFEHLQRIIYEVLQVNESTQKEMNRMILHGQEVGELRSGECFGLPSLTQVKPRAASIRCLKDCHFGVLSKDDYELVTGKI